MQDLIPLLARHCRLSVNFLFIGYQVSMGIKWLEHVPNHSTNIEKAWLLNPTPPLFLHCIVLSHVGSLYC